VLSQFFTSPRWTKACGGIGHARDDCFALVDRTEFERCCHNWSRTPCAARRRAESCARAPPTGPDSGDIRLSVSRYRAASRPNTRPNVFDRLYRVREASRLRRRSRSRSELRQWAAPGARRQMELRSSAATGNLHDRPRQPHWPWRASRVTRSTKRRFPVRKLKLTNRSRLSRSI